MPRGFVTRRAFFIPVKSDILFPCASTSSFARMESLKNLPASTASASRKRGRFCSTTHASVLPKMDISKARMSTPPFPDRSCRKKENHRAGFSQRTPAGGCANYSWRRNVEKPQTLRGLVTHRAFSCPKVLFPPNRNMLYF